MQKPQTLEMMESVVMSSAQDYPAKMAGFLAGCLTDMNGEPDKMSGKCPGLAASPPADTRIPTLLSGYCRDSELMHSSHWNPDTAVGLLSGFALMDWPQCIA